MFYQKKEKLKNKNKIFKFISSHKEFNKQSITEALDFSFPTVTKFIDEFLKLGIINEIGFIEGKSGRKSLTYRFNPNNLLSVGIKVEVDRISLILINLNGQEIKKSEIYNNFFNDVNFVNFIVTELKKFLYNFSDYKKIRGIGISLPGIVNDITKQFEIGTNFQLFSKDMKFIEDEMQLPVYLINEANAGVFAEYILSNYIHDNLAYISIDTGVGAGIIINGKLYQGSHSQAGEIGHISVIPNGKKCSCGNFGCLERYCSNTSLVESFKNEFKLESLKLYEIFSLKLHETEQGKEILNTYISYLASAIRTFQLIFDLNKIIVGGEICYFTDEFNFKERLKAEVFNNVFCKDDTILEFSKYGDLSNLFGAALLPFKEFL
ncbi:MAG: ROK family protein [Cetobacterium sp.]|uniref:ROK family protein n=3 Tax=Cetobacterium sp. TaxID=2071632 RepID=UPI002FC8E66E